MVTAALEWSPALADATGRTITAEIGDQTGAAVIDELPAAPGEQLRATARARLADPAGDPPQGLRFRWQWLDADGDVLGGPSLSPTLALAGDWSEVSHVVAAPTSAPYDEAASARLSVLVTRPSPYDEALAIEVEHVAVERRAPVPVFDAPPAGTPLPYVTVTGPAVAAAHPVASLRSDLFFYLTVWSTYRGRKEVAELIDRLHAALHDSRPSLTGGGVAIHAWVTRQDIARDADEMTFQGSMTLRVLVNH